MVFVINLLIGLLISVTVSASQLDEFLGPQDPAYFQTIAPRFISWAEKEFSNKQSPRQKEMIQIIQDQIQNLQSWSFSPFDNDYKWARIQLGLRFENKKETDAYFAIFPDDVTSLNLKLKKAVSFKIPKNLQEQKIIGVGFNFHTHEVYLYHKRSLSKNISLKENFKPQSQTVLNLIKIKSNHSFVSQDLVKIGPLKLQDFTLSTFVGEWSVWIENSSYTYDTTLTRFNPVFLEPYAKKRIKQIGSEFLMSTLRIQFRDKNDFAIIYP